MKRFAKLAMPIVLLTSLSACASRMGWQPTDDVSRDTHSSALNADYAECRALAEHASNSGTMVAAGTGIGAAAGAAGGAAIGALTGSSLGGAALGAISGGGFGFFGSMFGTNKEFKTAYTNCLKERGHPVIN